LQFIVDAHNQDTVNLKPITSPKQIRLTNADAARPKALASKRLDDAADEQVDRIRKLQQKFYADGRFALLIVLQGRDASGKDGTIRKVFRGVNPMGCDVTSFKAPTEQERAHDYLWRVHPRIPSRRMIGIFNRSHYEDVIVPRVHKYLGKKIIAERLDQINRFERMLAENSVVILKFFLHISRDEQKKRLIERLEDKKKNWKFRAGDLDDRERWDDFTKAYRDAIARCSTSWARWYVVPADDENARDYLIARKIADTLEDLDLHYPPLDPEVKGIKIK
jgi:PPK2 family polyphosphate:nucleotide phosphotransferase